LQRSHICPVTEASWQTHWPVSLSQVWFTEPAVWHRHGRQPVTLDGEK